MRLLKKALLLPLFVGVTLAVTISCNRMSDVPEIDMSAALDKNNIIPVLIIGSGPAGLSAGVYVARASIPGVIMEGDKPGGLLTQTTDVENWPGEVSILGQELIDNMREQVKKLGIAFLSDTVEQIDCSAWPYQVKTEGGKTLYALSLIVATGSNPRLLGIPGEQEYWGKGVTSCAVCDAPFYRGDDVVVIGGGDSAVEEAIQLSGYAKSITVMVRRDSMRAAARMQSHLKGYPNISVKYNVQVKEILGDGNQVTGLMVFDNKHKETYHMPIGGVFLAIGHIPNSGFIKNCVTTTPQGNIVIFDGTQQTSQRGIFAAGDVEDARYRQAITSAGSGARAGLDAVDFLNQIGYTSEIAEQLRPCLFNVASKRKKSATVEVTNAQELDELLGTTDKPVLVDFYAETCPSCMQMLPMVEAVAADFQESLVIAKVDAEVAIDLLEKYHILKLPTMLMFKDGKLAARVNTAFGRKDFVEFIQQFIA